MPYPFLFNPTLQESAKKIKSLVSQYPTTSYFSTRSPYTLKDGRTIRLTHPLLAFTKPSETRKTEKRNHIARYYAVIQNTELGKGGCGFIRPILGTWKMLNGEYLYKTKSSEDKVRVLKSAPLGLRNELEREQFISSYTPHLSTKYPVIMTEDYAHLIMRRQPGAELFTYLNFLYGQRNYISATQRILLCIELLNMLHQQAHSIDIPTQKNQIGKIIHRDIKPENIMICEDGFQFELNLIDFGLSEITGEETGIPRGTPAYVEPIHLHNSITLAKQSDDIFGMAIVFSKIWHDVSERENLNQYDLQEANKDIQFKDLFKHIESLPEKQQDDLESLLHMMTQPEPNLRYSIEEAIEQFQNILLQRYCSLSSPLPFLQRAITDLQTQLHSYKQLSLQNKRKLDKECLAAEALITLLSQVIKRPGSINIAELIGAQLNDSKSLSETWIGLNEELFNYLTTFQLPIDSPNSLRTKLSSLIENYELIRDNHAYYLAWMANELSHLQLLSAIYQRMKFLSQTKIKNLYHIHLNSKSTEASSKEIIRQLSHFAQAYFSSLHVQIEGIDTRLQLLAKEATNLNSVMTDDRFKAECIYAHKLEQLYRYYSTYNQDEAVQVIKQFFIEDPFFVSAYPKVLARLKAKLKEKLTFDLKSYTRQQSSSIFWEKAPERADKINILFDRIGSLLDQPIDDFNNLKYDLFSVLIEVHQEVITQHEKGFYGGIGLTQSRLATLLLQIANQLCPDPNENMENNYTTCKI